MRAPLYIVVSFSYFYFFSKYVRWLYIPTEGQITTYRYFFALEGKKPLKALSQVTFAIAKLQYLFRNSQLSHCFSKYVRWLYVPSGGQITMYDGRLASLKVFFILEQRNIYMWLYVPRTGHLTI